MTTRVLIAEDAHVLRETLVTLLELEDDLDVVVSVSSGDRIVPAALAHHPDVALLDVGLPVVDGLTAATVLAAQLPTCRALILTNLRAQEHLVRARAAGAWAFLTKDAPADVLIDTIRRVAWGERLIDMDATSQHSG
jgi:two-component system response regulator DesR